MNFGRRTALHLTAYMLLIRRISAFQDNPGKCSMQVVITDPFGKESSDHYTLRLLSYKRELIRTGVNGFNDVPFGEYFLVATSGCCKAERFLSISNQNLFVRMAVRIRYGDSELPGGELVVEGLIQPLRRLTKDTWVRVRGIFLDATCEGKLDSAGHFTLPRLDMGTYAFEVFNGPKLLYTRTFELDPTNSPYLLNVNLI